MTRLEAGRVRVVTPFVLGLGGLLAFFLAQDLMARRLSTLMLELPGGDKVFHCLEFFFAFLVLHYLAGRLVERPGYRLGLALGAGVLLAIGDEALQVFFSARNVDIRDFAANLCGVWLGATFVRADWRPAVRVAGAVAMILVTAGLAIDSYVKLKDYNQGILHERRHEFALARQAYQRAMASGFRSAGLYNGLSWVEIESGEGSPVKAVEYGEEALALSPGNPDVLDTYGWALHHAGRHEEALGLLLEAYDKKPTMFCIHYHLGEVYLALGRSDEAAGHFRKQLVTAPEADETRRAREALAKLGEGT